MSDKPKPFHAYSVKIPPSLEKVILKALDKNPQSRYLTADDFKQALIAVIGERKKTKKTPWFFFSVAAGLLIVYFIIYQVYFLAQKEKVLFRASPAPIHAPSVKAINVKSDVVPIELQYSQNEKVQRLLKVAEAHAKVGRLLSPVGSNAYEAYQLVLSIESQNLQAKKGLVMVKMAYLDKISQLISDGRLTDAKIHLEVAREFFPEEKSVLNQLKEKIESGLPKEPSR